MKIGRRASVNPEAGKIADREATRVARSAALAITSHVDSMIARRHATISAIASATSRGPAAVPAAVSATSDGRNRSASYFGGGASGHGHRKLLLHFRHTRHPWR